jgi:hypothetical protein
MAAPFVFMKISPGSGLLAQPRIIRADVISDDVVGADDIVRAEHETQ